jgi:hypothetical protein
MCVFVGEGVRAASEGYGLRESLEKMKKKGNGDKKESTKE